MATLASFRSLSGQNEFYCIAIQYHHKKRHRRLCRTYSSEVARRDAGQGPDSIEKMWLEFLLEKPLEFLLGIPYTNKMGSLDMLQNQTGFSIGFTSQNSCLIFPLNWTPEHHKRCGAFRVLGDRGLCFGDCRRFPQRSGRGRRRSRPVCMHRVHPQLELRRHPHCAGWSSRILQWKWNCSVTGN